MVGEDPFQGGAQIGRRVKYLPKQPVLRQPRPLGYDVAAGYRAANKERNGSRSVVRAVRAIDASRAAEFRDYQDNGVLPRLTKAFLQFVKGAVESRKPRRELALRSALIGVGVVAVERDRQDARSVRSGEEPSGSRGGLAHASGLPCAPLCLSYIVRHFVVARETLSFDPIS